MFSTEQLAHFKADGFLLVAGFYRADDMHSMLDWTAQIERAPETPGKQWMYFEASKIPPHDRILSRVENFVPHCPGFQNLVDGRLREAVADLLGEPAVLFKDKINFKLPGADGFKVHQDVQAGWEQYAHHFITAMVAMDSSTAANGGLEVARGAGLDRLIGTLGAPLTQADLAGMEFVPVDCKPGDAVFFDAYVPHRSGPNTSDTSRRVLYITYNARSEGDHRKQYYADKWSTYPPDCEREPGRVYEFKV